MNHIKTDRQLRTHEPGSGPGDRLYAEGVLRKKSKQARGRNGHDGMNQ